MPRLQLIQATEIWCHQGQSCRSLGIQHLTHGVFELLINIQQQKASPESTQIICINYINDIACYSILSKSMIYVHYCTFIYLFIYLFITNIYIYNKLIYSKCYGPEYLWCKHQFLGHSFSCVGVVGPGEVRSAIKAWSTFTSTIFSGPETLPLPGILPHGSAWRTYANIGSSWVIMGHVHCVTSSKSISRLGSLCRSWRSSNLWSAHLTRCSCLICS